MSSVDGSTQGEIDKTVERILRDSDLREPLGRGFAHRHRRGGDRSL
jgi:hypothetical protein